MNLIDRHIFTSVLFTCAAAVGLFAFVVALPNIVRELLGPLLVGQLDFNTFLRLVGLLFPFAISYALPMGILTGVLLTLGRLSADSEITALRASGISVARIARPVFLLGALGAAGALYVNFESMPWARVQYYREFAAAVRSDPLKFIVPKTFIRDFKGAVVYVGARDGGFLRDIWVWRLDDENRVISFERSRTGRVEFDEGDNSLRLTLTPAQVETREEDNPEDFTKRVYVNLFSILQLNLPLDRYFARNVARMKDDWLTYPEIREKQARVTADAAPTEKPAQRRLDLMKLEVIVQEKFNLAVAVFSFALIGVPLGIKVSRRETSANLGLALLLVLGFYLLTMVMKSLDRHPEYRPDLLLWLPNVLFLGLGLWLFSRIDRR